MSRCACCWGNADRAVAVSVKCAPPPKSRAIIWLKTAYAVAAAFCPGFAVVVSRLGIEMDLAARASLRVVATGAKPA